MPSYDELEYHDLSAGGLGVAFPVSFRVPVLDRNRPDFSRNRSATDVTLGCCARGAAATRVSRG